MLSRHNAIPQQRPARFGWMMHALAITLAAATLAVTTGCADKTGHAAERPAAFTVPTLMARGDGSDKEFGKMKAHWEKLSARIASNANDIDAYTELAQLFMQEARITGRHHEYVPQARLLLDEALRRRSNDFNALITKGSLLMTLHQFEEAKEITERAVAQNPYSAFAYGVLCDALVELGEYDAAARACDTMLSRRPDLRSYARASYVRELFGDRKGAIDAMMMAADAGAVGTEERSWTLYNLGNLFLHQGKLDTAAFIFNGILEERPNYAYALSGLAMTKRARGNHAEAIELLVKASQLSNEHLFIEQLSDLYLAMGSKESARTMEEKVIEAFKQHEAGGWNVDREWALYCANHAIDLPGALARAKRELGRRPDNIDVQETYAWALFKNGRAAEAIPYIEKAMRLGKPAPTTRYHAAMIYNAAGMRAKGAAQMKMAVRENAYVEAMGG